MHEANHSVLATKRDF